MNARGKFAVGNVTSEQSLRREDDFEYASVDDVESAPTERPGSGWALLVVATGCLLLSSFVLRAADRPAHAYCGAMFAMGFEFPDSTTFAPTLAPTPDSTTLAPTPDSTTLAPTGGRLDTNATFASPPAVPCTYNGMGANGTVVEISVWTTGVYAVIVLESPFVAVGYAKYVEEAGRRYSRVDYEPTYARCARDGFVIVAAVWGVCVVYASLAAVFGRRLREPPDGYARRTGLRAIAARLGDPDVRFERKELSETERAASPSSVEEAKRGRLRSLLREALEELDRV